MDLIVDYPSCKESYDRPNEITKCVARNTIPFGSLDFALRYYPSFGHFVVPSYAIVAAYDFMHAPPTFEGLELKRNLIILGLRWRYGIVHGIPSILSPTFFVIEHFDRMIASLGKTGESIRDCNVPYALVSFLCIDAPHTVDPEVVKKCESYLKDSPKNVPIHVLLYSLCLNATIPWEVRNEIIMTTLLTEKPAMIDKKMRMERDNDIMPQISSNFPYATGSRVLGVFQFLEQTQFPNPSYCSLDFNHFKIYSYLIERSA